MSTNAYEAAEVLMKPSRLVSPGTDFDGTEFPPTQHNIEMAKVWATMAVAYEQRTANLIAVFGQLCDGDSDTYLGNIFNGKSLAKQIKERLDIV